MTAITLANIPNAIVTLEQLVVWNALSLATVNPTLAILEQENLAQLAAQSAIFTAADNSIRMMIRCSIPLDPAFRYDRTKKLWLFANELSNVALPAAYLTN